MLLLDQFPDPQLALEALCCELDGTPRVCIEAVCGLARRDAASCSVAIATLNGTEAAELLEQQMDPDADALPLSQVVKICGVFITPSWYLYLLGWVLHLAELDELDCAPGVSTIVMLPPAEPEQPPQIASAREVRALFDIARSMGVERLGALEFTAGNATGPTANLLAELLEDTQEMMELASDSTSATTIESLAVGSLRSAPASGETRAVFDYLAGELESA